MTRGVVVVYFSQLGGRLRHDQKIVLDADAQLIAELKDYDFGGRHQAACDYPAALFFVPDDVLLREEASALGIRDPTDFYGGVVPHPFVKTKAITHPLVDEHAQRPQGWSAVFAGMVHEVTLPGYTVFDADDARVAARRMLDRGPVRLKEPLGASGRGQAVVTSMDQLDSCLDQLGADEMSKYGLMLEENLREVRTLSVGQVALDQLVMSYYGTQRRVRDNHARAIYGGSDLVCVRGGWEALEALQMDPESRTAVAQAKLYDRSVNEYPGFMASRRNYDICQGVNAAGHRRSGVLESSWRAGGASSAELAALAALTRDPGLQMVEASAVEEFGKGRQPPAGAIVHFNGEDPQLGPLLRYTVVNGKTVRREQHPHDPNV